jgi:methyl-accepting chemotaxis protein
LNARPLLRTIRVANQVAAGDLRVEELTSARKDEIGQLMRSVNTMVVSLRELIGRVTDGAQQVAQSADDLTASTEQTTLTTEQITTSIQEVAVGSENIVESATTAYQLIDEMSHGIGRIAETAVVVAEASMETTHEAERGNESVQRAVEQMDQIRETVHGSAEAFRVLEQRSHEIEKIVEVITGIANQTNLLALNAAIEAARAGEHGKGFAVVADEVRKLAEQSGESAGQIIQLIQTIQEETTRAVGSMDEVIKEVESGTQVVHEAGDAFGRILLMAKQVSDQIQDVTASSEEMTANSYQVAQAVAGMTETAKTSAGNAETVAAASEQQLATIEEISASSETLSKLAHELQELVGKFKV